MIPAETATHERYDMYLNLIELAESFGVSEKVVEDWIRDEGLPHVPDRGRLLFDRARVAHWAAAHGLTARAGFLAPENGAFTSGLALAPMLRTGGIWRDRPAAGVTRGARTGHRVLAGRSRRPFAPCWAQRLRAKGGINWAPGGRWFRAAALQHAGDAGSRRRRDCAAPVARGLAAGGTPARSACR